MKRLLPIYQMALVPNRRNRPEVIFSSELANEQIQEPLFCIPIDHTLNRNEELGEYLNESELYMPFSIAEETMNIEATIDFPYIYFYLEKYSTLSSEVIRFIIELTRLDKKNVTEIYDQPFVKRIFELIPQKYGFNNSDFICLNYSGNWEKIDKSKTKLLLIKPLDLLLLENIFLEKKITPVGLTPMFGYSK